MIKTDFQTTFNFSAFVKKQANDVLLLVCILETISKTVSVHKYINRNKKNVNILCNTVRREKNIEI